MIDASCLCGGVAYRVEGPFELMAQCYCTECRKASGADHATNCTVAEDQIDWLRGRELLKEYESSPGNRRCFCSQCGSPVLKRFDADPGKVRLRMGLFEADPEVRPIIRVFVGERAPWTVVPDDLPSFEGKPVPPDPPPPTSPTSD